MINSSNILLLTNLSLAKNSNNFINTLATIYLINYQYVSHITFIQITEEHCLYNTS